MGMPTMPLPRCYTKLQHGGSSTRALLRFTELQYTN